MTPRRAARAAFELKMADPPRRLERDPLASIDGSASVSPRRLEVRVLHPVQLPRAVVRLVLQAVLLRATRGGEAWLRWLGPMDFERAIESDIPPTSNLRIRDGHPTVHGRQAGRNAMCRLRVIRAIAGRRPGAASLARG